MCRQPDNWEVLREEVIGILVEAKKGGQIRKICILDNVGYTAVLFFDKPLIKKWERPSVRCRFWFCRLLDVVAIPPGLYLSADLPVE